MKILITGHRGYIGSRLYEILKNDGYDVTGIDLRDGQDIVSANLPDADVVYHLAAQAGAIPSMEDPMWDAHCNILGTIAIAKRYGKTSKIIYVTSGGAVEPVSAYGLSKKTGEEYLKIFARNVVQCRLSSVYGDKPRGVVDTFLRDEKCTIYGDGSAVRDFVHVSDIVAGLEKAKHWSRGEYCLGSGIGTTIASVAKATGKEIDYKPARNGELAYAVLQNTTPDWEPKIDVIEYVKQS